jgi:hypothetical protein
MRPIPTRVHGALDYMTVVALFALPRLLGWSDHLTTLMTAMAVITLIYSLITRYELGALGTLPMRGHLVLDFVSGLVFLAAALLLTREPDGVRAVLAAIGAFEIGASLLTQTEPAPLALPGTRSRAGHV